MPAWITSELRELVWVPIASSASRTTTSRPAMARARATARPTTPAPITTASSFSTQQELLESKGRRAGERRDAGHRPRAAVESGAQKTTHDRAGGEADGADERGGRTGGGGKRRQGRRGRVRHDERGAEEEDEERDHHREPVCHARPGEARGGRAAGEHQRRAGAQQPRDAQARHEPARRPGAAEL